MAMGASTAMMKYGLDEAHFCPGSLLPSRCFPAGVWSCRAISPSTLVPKEAQVRAAARTKQQAQAPDQAMLFAVKQSGVVRLVAAPSVDVIPMCTTI